MYWHSSQYITEYTVSVLQLVSADHKEQKDYIFFVMTPNGEITEWYVGFFYDSYTGHDLPTAHAWYEEYLSQGYQETEALHNLAQAMDNALSLAKECGDKEEVDDIRSQWKVVCDLIASQPGGQEFLDRF